MYMLVIQTFFLCSSFIHLSCVTHTCFLCYIFIHIYVHLSFILYTSYDKYCVSILYNNLVMYKWPIKQFVPYCNSLRLYCVLQRLHKIKCPLQRLGEDLEEMMCLIWQLILVSREGRLSEVRFTLSCDQVS